MTNESSKPEFFLSSPKVAKLCGASRNTVHLWIREGRLPFSLAGGTYRIRPVDLKCFLEEQQMVVPEELAKLVATLGEEPRPPRPLNAASRSIVSNRGKKPDTCAKMERTSGDGVKCAIDTTPVVIACSRDRVFRSITMRSLEPLHIHVFQAETGFEAVHLFIQHPEVAMIILKLAKPGRDGINACKEIRRLNKNIPLLVFGNSSSDATLFGADQPSLFTKDPVHTELLQNKVNSLLYL